MIQSLAGTIGAKSGHAVVVEVGGVGFKVAVPARTAASLRAGETVTLSTHLHVREDALDLYGFEDEATRELFELLISVNGVGPKSALAVLDVADLRELTAAIQEGRPDLLTGAAGIGRKTAERIVLELRGKVAAGASGKTVERMEGDADLAETLVGLGYRRDEVKSVLCRLDPATTALDLRLKAALALLAKKRN